MSVVDHYIILKFTKQFISKLSSQLIFCGLAVKACRNKKLYADIWISFPKLFYHAGKYISARHGSCVVAYYDHAVRLFFSKLRKPRRCHRFLHGLSYKLNAGSSCRKLIHRRAKHRSIVRDFKIYRCFVVKEFYCLHVFLFLNTLWNICDPPLAMAGRAKL